MVRGAPLRNPALANPASRSPGARQLARATFRGRFAERAAGFGGERGRRNPRGVVIGWAGPVFWPYAYDDFVDYAFSPYAYDEFWPHAYDDVYEGIFGPYAFADGAYANTRQSGRRGRSTARAAPAGVAQVCAAQAAGLTDWPIERIAEVVEPNDAQRAALDDLKGATEQTVQLLQSACPTDLPSTPTGRLAAMRQRTETMLQAVRIVRPALETFYLSLSDEQKARFNAIAPDAQPAAQAPAKGQGADLSQACNAQASQVPTAAMGQVLRPTEPQRALLDDLTAAAAKTADELRANCAQDQTLTPPGRIEAMEKRLEAMLQALDTLQPALEKFYQSLNDEQKARFNQLGTRQG